jgi:hypothetical protein
MMPVFQSVAQKIVLPFILDKPAAHCGKSGGEISEPGA